MKIQAQNTTKTDAGLLLLRGTGLVLLFTFGIQKSEYAIRYLGAGKPWALYPLVGLVRGVGFPLPQMLTAYAILCESLFALMVALGIGTRICAVLILISMIAALYTSICIHDPVVSKGSAIQYIIIFAAIAVMGPGKFSIDGYWQHYKSGKN